MDHKNVIEMRNISKSFGGVHALDNVTLHVRKGEIHALVGQNGAGKSTLMKILSGAYQKDEGEIYVDGKKFKSTSVIDSHKAGIGIIYQEFALAPDLTVMENIFINNLSLKKSRIGAINYKKLQQESDKVISRLGFDLDTKMLVGDLTVAYQQIVEIAKALSQDVKVLVLDEPTAVLSPYETKQLFDILRHLKEHGTSIIYISHRLDEIFELSDRITIMKDGKVVETVDTKQTTIDNVIMSMIGKSISAMFPKRTYQSNGDVVLSVKGICNGSRAEDISFDVSRGEIFGVAGLVGAGKTEMARSIFGVDAGCKGEVFIYGKKCHIKSPRDAIRAGIGYLPESRKAHGVILEETVRSNITMVAMDKVTKYGVIQAKKEKAEVQKLIDALNTKLSGKKGGDSLVGDLSGGNQQKVSLSKWLFAENQVIILDEPTRGVDVNAKSEIYAIINELTQKGLAFIVISSELEEVIGLSDRILILNKGRMVGITRRGEVSQEKLLNLSVGMNA